MLAPLGRPGGRRVIFAIEFVADKIPYVDSTWDAISTAIRPTVGAVIGVLLAGDATSLEQAVLGVVGGGTALLSHLVKAGGRLAINGSPEPVSNTVASVTEDVTVLGVVWLAIEHPQPAAAIAAVLLARGLVMLVVVGRFVRRGWRRWKGRDPVRAATSTSETAYDARPSAAHRPSVRSGDQPRQKMTASATAVIAKAVASALASTGRSSGPVRPTRALAVEEGVQGEEDAEVRDHADDGRGDAGQRRGEVVVAAQPLDVRRPEQHPQEARHEGDPRGQQRGEQRRDPGVERARVAVAADEGDELDHHDQRPRRRLGERQPAHHLPRAPASRRPRPPAGRRRRARRRRHRRSPPRRRRRTGPGRAAPATSGAPSPRASTGANHSTSPTHEHAPSGGATAAPGAARRR